MTTTEGQHLNLRPLWKRLRGVPAVPEGEEAPLRLWTDGLGVLWLAGALEHDTVAEVRVALRSCEPSADTTVDVSGLHFIDSSGLGCLLAHDDRVRRAGGRFVLRHPGPALCRVFEVTGARQRLTIEPLPA